MIKRCGALDKSQCDLSERIENKYSEKNIFLDIPYQNYDDCEKALCELLSEVSLNPIIAKDKFTSKQVLCKVCELIKTCKYGITDISSGSNSVSYEYGLMHGLGKKVCLMMRAASKKFSDIDGLEHISYKDIRSFRIAIAKWIFDNIIEIDKLKIEQIIKSEEKLLQEQGEIILRNISDTKEGINQESKKLQEQILDKFQVNAKRKLPSLDQMPLRILFAIPLNLKNEIITANVLSKRKNDIITSTRSPFPCSDPSSFERSHKSMSCTENNNITSTYFEINTFGGIFFYEYMKYEKDNFGGIHAYAVIQRLLTFILSVSNFYQAINYLNEINFIYLFKNIQGLDLTSENSLGLSHKIGKFNDGEIKIEREIATEDLIDNKKDEIILDIYEELRGATNSDEAYDRKITRSQLGKVKHDVLGS